MKIIECRARTVNTLSIEAKAKAAEKIKKLQKEGEKMIKGVFEFVDAQGGWFDFDYRFYPGEPIRTIKITHGEIIDIPMDVAKHLNNVYKRIRTVRENLDNGRDIVTKISRTRFIPMEMMT
jgi:predicted SpoU family rRNA methylase